MLKRDITYEDFNGDTVTETFYFNLSKPELIELDVEHKDGLGAMLENIIKANDGKELIKQFKELVLLSYGEKSEDGKRFMKSDKSREDFSHTAAYHALFMELATDDKAAAIFLKGVLPKDMTKQLDDNGNLVQLPVPPKPPVPPTNS